GRVHDCEQGDLPLGVFDRGECLVVRGDRLELSPGEVTVYVGGRFGGETEQAPCVLEVDLGRIGGERVEPSDLPSGEVARLRLGDGRRGWADRRPFGRRHVHALGGAVELGPDQRGDGGAV